MGDALAELETILRSSKDKLTLEEENVLRTCKGRAIRDFTIGACVASATQRLTYGQRFNYSGGAAILSGMWRFDRSLNSSLDHILALDGSRMQRMLANLLLTKNRDDPWRMQVVSKHFYSEKVFDDLNPDQPLSRWRRRNIFGDNVAQRTHDDNYNDQPRLEPKQFTRSPGEDVTADPLDYIFGYSKPSGEIHHPDTISPSPKRRVRNHRRAHRRHRTRNPEV
ncbi:uncharacterized protein LOC143887009 isoform X2 [Tasmannia lanceolata]|uniref:uncharacterized protein LOC143887009 isoform X2 n=1 Tax=Tasmannia lanceolata TaxID=3420 RepID=UPI0040637A27